MSEYFNVFGYDYFNWKNPTNWFRNIKQFFRNVKYAWQRAVNGFCTRDIWNLDTYYKMLIHDSLIHLANNHDGYPDVEPYFTDEGWTSYLLEMADHFYKSIYDYSDEIYENPYWEKVDAYRDIDRELYLKYRDLWLDREKEITVLQRQELEEGLKMLGQSFTYLWD